MSGAQAADGTVTFLGSVHSGACSIKPESVDQTIHLGAIAKHQLQAGGKSEARRVLIELEGCDLTNLTDNTVTTTFTAAPSTDVPGAIGTVGTAGRGGRRALRRRPEWQAFRRVGPGFQAEHRRHA